MSGLSTTALSKVGLFLNQLQEQVRNEGTEMHDQDPAPTYNILLLATLRSFSPTGLLRWNRSGSVGWLERLRDLATKVHVQTCVL